MNYENTYLHLGPERIDSDVSSEYKAAIVIDAFPDDDAAPGHVVAEVFLTQHDDIVIAWHDNGERSNTSVLELIKDSVRQLKESHSTPAGA